MGKLKFIGEAVEGGLNLMRGASKAEEAAQAAEKVTAAERAAAGRKAAELIKAQEQMKASEALGRLREKGMKRVTTTQADRTRVGGGNIGGASFPAISEADPLYAGKVWGVMDEGTAARLKNLTTPDTAWTTMLGSANQLKTNPIVFDKLKRGFLDSMKQGNLSPELEAKINHNLALTFGEGASIRDPKIWKEADTFEKRAALADLMMGQGIPPSKGGVALGGEKSGKGVIFKPTDILKKETEPTLLHTEHGGDTPTFAAGPRLFTLEKESVNRPDLHPGFPTLLQGKDLGMNMAPVPTEVFLPDWHKAFREKKPERFQGPWSPEIVGRRKSGSYQLKGAEGPGYYDLALGLEGEGLPSQELTDEYIRHLLREGFKDGGKVEDFDAKVDKLIEKHHFDSHVDRKIEEHFAKGGAPKVQLKHTTLRMGTGGLLGKGAKALAGAMKAAEVVPAAEKEVIKQAPSIIIPSKISNVKEAVRQSKGDFGARRVERAADEIPNLEKLYKEEALRQAFAGDNAKALMTMNPKDFEKYAAPLDPRFTDKASTRHTPSGERVTYQEYMDDYLPNVGAFNDVPFLQINKEEQGLPLKPFITGHEGRHRNRVLANKGEKAGLVQLLPRAELREPFPRRSQEEYLQALRDELEMTGNLVLPEKYTVPSDSIFEKEFQRPAIVLPDVYAKGGAIIKHTTLRNRKPSQAQPIRFKEGGKSEATVQATPRNKVLGKASDLLKKGHEFVSKPFGYENPPAEMVSDFIGVPALSRVLDKLSYGEPITNMGKANVPLIPEDTFDAAGAVLGGLGSASKLAKPIAKAAGKLPKDIPVGLSIKAVGDIPTGAPAPRQEALRLAQQRAALPKEKGGLGLPKNNTAEQRAEAMGFDKDTFHGSLNDIEKFDSNRASTESHAGKGVYSTDSADDASLNYASVYGPDVEAKIGRAMDERDKDWRKLHGRLRDEALTPRQQEILLRNTLNSDNLGVVYPLKVRSNKSIHLDAPESNPVRIGPFEHYDEAADAYVDTPHTAKFNEALDEFRELGGDANPIYETVQDYGDAIPARDVFNAVKKTGNESGLYDPYTGDIVSGGVAAGDFMKHFGIDEIRHTPQFMNQQLNLGKEHTISLDPDNVRSRFAAFDPWRKTAAIAAAMGVAAPDLLAKEKKKRTGGVILKHTTLRNRRANQRVR